VLFIRVSIRIRIAISINIHIVARPIGLPILQLATQTALPLHPSTATATDDLTPAAYGGLNAFLQALVRIAETPSDRSATQSHLSQLNSRALANVHRARRTHLELARLLAAAEMFDLLSQMLVLLCAGLELLVERGDLLVLLPDGASELEFPELGAVGGREGHPEGEGGVEVGVYFIFEFLGAGVERGLHGGAGVVGVEDVVGVGGFGVVHGAGDSSVVEGVAEEVC
jgi:hypothetical protein